MLQRITEKSPMRKIRNSAHGTFRKSDVEYITGTADILAVPVIDIYNNKYQADIYRWK